MKTKALTIAFVCLLFVAVWPIQWVHAQGDAALGKAKYMAVCFVCHGATGDGKGPAAIAVNPKPLNLTDGAYVPLMSDEYLFKMIKFGLAPVVNGEVDVEFTPVAMPPYEGQISDSEIAALVEYVKAVSTGGTPSEEGEKLYQVNCALCHGVDKKGLGSLDDLTEPVPAYLKEFEEIAAKASSEPELMQPPPPSLLDAKYMNGRFTDEFLTTLFKKGKIAATTGKFTTMQPFANTLKDEDIWNIIAYIRTLAQ
jgi:mono/diheme cytochrome c family protein